MKRLFSEENLHTLFDLGIIAKAIDSIGEIALGVLCYSLSPQTVNNLAAAILGDELTEQPRDLIWSLLLHGWTASSLAFQHFWGFILLGHGIIKLALVIGLVKDKLWIYPVAATAFALFDIYQIYDIIYSHSLLITLLTLLDIVFITLIVHEYRYQKKIRRTNLPLVGH